MTTTSPVNQQTAPKSPSEVALLAEYQFAHEEVDRLNKQVWGSAQLIIPLSLAGLGIFCNFSTHSRETVATVLLFGVVSSLILAGWLSIARRWLVYQGIAQMRLLEIEMELNLWCTRYELFASSRDVLGRITSKFYADCDKPRLEKVPGQGLRFGQSTSITLRNLVALMIIAWGLVVIREVTLWLTS